MAGHCKNCGETYTSGQKFCGKCGSGLSSKNLAVIRPF
ncbi:MAG: zinc-ribbon domain-containing protein [Candidatus Thorarchaeota archaeon]